MPMTAAQLATLRRFTAESSQAPYDDATLNAMYDANLADINVTAAEVWREKAARAAALVDTSEGASSRKMSQVYTQSIKQAEFYGGTGVPGAPVIVRGAKTRAIER